MWVKNWLFWFFVACSLSRCFHIQSFVYRDKLNGRINKKMYLSLLNKSLCDKNWTIQKANNAVTQVTALIIEELFKISNFLYLNKTFFGFWKILIYLSLLNFTSFGAFENFSFFFNHLFSHVNLTGTLKSVNNKTSAIHNLDFYFQNIPKKFLQIIENFFWIFSNSWNGLLRELFKLKTTKFSFTIWRKHPLWLTIYPYSNSCHILESFSTKQLFR